jgi:integrase
MKTDRSPPLFQSILAPLLEKFIQEKRACGYRYDEGTRILGHFDRFLSGNELKSTELPRSLTKQFLSKQAHESSSTHRHRITLVRQFALFLIRLGYSAYVPDLTLVARERASFTPRILTQDEIRQLLQAADQLVPMARSPLRHLVMPEIFRLLYGCGMRLGEVLNLQVRDVDLNQGVLTVRQGKFRKDRLVPPAPSLVIRLRKYAARLGNRPHDAFFFPAPSGGPYKIWSIYTVFRKLLLECGIAHAGRGKGPRIHDARHAFAIHTLLRWYRDGADLDAKLPLLATYLGHQNLSGTQKYLHLSGELFPEVITRVNTDFGDVIPRRSSP